MKSQIDKEYLKELLDRVPSNEREEILQKYDIENIKYQEGVRLMTYLLDKIYWEGVINEKE